MIKYGRVTLKKSRKLRHTYFLILRTIVYVKWKKNALELFSSVHDLETLARILRSRKKVAESSVKLADGIFISVMITVIIIEYAKYCAKHFTKLIIKNIAIAFLMLLVLFVFLHLVSLRLIRKIQFYQCCLDLLNND